LRDQKVGKKYHRDLEEIFDGLSQNFKMKDPFNRMYSFEIFQSSLIATHQS